MNGVVFEQVPVAELPEQRRSRLNQAGSDTVTVWIEQATPPTQTEALGADDPLFGMWSDREDMAQVAGYVRKLRASRFNDDAPKPDA